MNVQTMKNVLANRPVNHKLAGKVSDLRKIGEYIESKGVNPIGIGKKSKMEAAIIEKLSPDEQAFAAQRGIGFNTALINDAKAFVEASKAKFINPRMPYEMKTAAAVQAYTPKSVPTASAYTNPSMILRNEYEAAQAALKNAVVMA